MDLQEAYEVFAPIYDAYTGDEEDQPFYHELALEHGGPVLELGCGTGRITIPVARSGVEIWGLDFSQPMLAQARRRIKRMKAATQERIHLVEADMTKYTLERQDFVLAMLPYSSFLHLLTQEMQLGMLKCTRKHLAPGGLFVLDVVEPSPYLMYQSSMGHAVTNDYGVAKHGRGFIRTLEDEQMDLATQRSVCSYRIWDCEENGTCKQIHTRFDLQMRYVFASELQLLFKLAGFKRVELYEDFRFSPYNAEGGRIVAVGKA